MQGALVCSGLVALDFNSGAAFGEEDVGGAGWTFSAF